ncbi:MAG TPA: hypothetical protein VGM99_01645 [Candidatus Cybelea sp.]
MSEYLIGAGAVLAAGPESSLTRASLHAQTDPHVAANIGAAVIDFEASVPDELSRIVIVAAGWSGIRFETEIVRPLLARRECTAADVMVELARATASRAVHLFARWLPDAAMDAVLSAAGIEVICHPVEAIRQAALVSGQRYSRWPASLRAA